MKKPELVRITPQEMFSMISDFADGLMCHLDPDDADRQLMLDIYKHILDLMQERNLEGRLAIITMLHGAVAMYETDLEQTCPTLLN